MAINIRVYRVSDENNKLNKTLGTYTTFNGTLKDETDIVNPEITLEVANNVITSSTDPFTTRNYLYMPTFGKYYFITDMNIIQSNLVRIKCHIDVLMSYSTQISSLKGTVRRNANLGDLYLTDTTHILKESYPLIQTKAFPNSISGSDYNFFLITAGGS